MPTRIVKYLDEMDKFREKSNDAIDELFNKVNPKTLILAKREEKIKYFKLLFIKYLKDNGNLFTQARKEGEKLGKSL